MSDACIIELRWLLCCTRDIASLTHSANNAVFRRDSFTHVRSVELDFRPRS